MLWGCIESKVGEAETKWVKQMASRKQELRGMASGSETESTRTRNESKVVQMKAKRVKRKARERETKAKWFK
jgi:hypothetical protein